MRRCWTHLHTSAGPALGLAIALFVLSAVGLLNDAKADIGDATHIGIRVVRPVDGVWVTVWTGPDWITRNLVTGNKIPVCSTVFPDATKDAIGRWHTALGVTVLEWKDNDDDCNPGNERWDPKEGIVGITVSKGVLVQEEDEIAPNYSGSVLGEECPTASGREPNDLHACAQMEVARESALEQVRAMNREWQSYYGRAEIVFNPNVYCRDINTRKSDDCNTGQTDYTLIAIITHEIGHVLALPDYFCGLGDTDHKDYLPAVNKAANKTLMNSWTAISECNAPGGIPTQRDKNDYRSMYLPAAVAHVAGGASDHLVTLMWDPSKVFVESGFEIQRKSGDAWEEVISVGPNARFVHFSAEQAEEHRYRVVSRTKALAKKEGDVTFGYVADDTASEEVRVTVKLSQPANLRITASTTSSLTLGWYDVDGEDGYDDRIVETTGTDCNVDPDQEYMVGEMTMSQLFTGLSASTAYLLCVRATLSSNPDATSNWASISRTTQAPPQPQPQPQPPPPTGVECLSSTDPGILVAVDNDCVTIRASRMLIDLHGEGHDEICGILMWDGTHWHRYAIVNDVLIPGSVNYTILGGAVLWLIDCGSARADGTWPPPPVPTAEELKRLARLAAK